MTTMIERVARALVAATPGTGSVDEHMDPSKGVRDSVWFPLARAAIEAMREPTESQLRAAWNKVDSNIDDFWRAMIDASLNEKETT